MSGGRIAHVVLGSPYGTGGKNGLVPSDKVLRLHLWAVASVATNLSAVLVVLSKDARKSEIAGYLDIEAEVRHAPYPIEVLRVTNNSLGSYGMYLHAFAVHRRRFDYYTFSEVDYVPVHIGFGGILAHLYDATFADGRPGFLVGVLQGRPIEPGNMPPHPQGAHIMSAAALEHLFDHVYNRQQWTGSMSERMVRLLRGSKSAKVMRATSGLYDHIQIGVGMLLDDAGIEMRDFSSAYRSPYWDHAHLLDWTGVSRHAVRRHAASLAKNVTTVLPINRSLFVPVQALFLRPVQRCCGHTWQNCRWQRGSSLCTVRDWRTGSDCCGEKAISRADGWRWLARHQEYTIPPAAVKAALRPLGAAALAGASLVQPPPWLVRQEARAQRKSQWRSASGDIASRHATAAS